MNPEENNPLSSSTGMSGMGNLGNTASMPGIGGLSMADSLASAQDNLTSAGLAAPSAQGVMGLDQLGASNPEAVMTPPAEDPLIPAAPVPGSIGSVTSVPASNVGTANPFAPVDSSTQSMQGGPVPVPEVAPQTPFNPFAPAASDQTTQNPVVPAIPSNPAVPVNNTQKAGGLNPAFQPAAPAAAKKSRGDKKSPHLLTILLGGLSALLAVALIIVIVLLIDAKNNPKIVYVPTTSNNEDTNDPLELLSCSREADFAYLVGSEFPISGLETLSVSYSRDSVKALSLNYNIIFGEGYDLNVARDNLVAGNAEFLGRLGANFNSDYAIDKDTLKAVIQSNDGATLSENDINTFLHPTGENLGMNSLNDVRSIYEGLGYNCSVE